MRNHLKDFKARALARPDVRHVYDGLAEEFELLDGLAHLYIINVYFFCGSDPGILPWHRGFSVG